MTIPETDSTISITVDRSKCCGYTLCNVEAPEIYSIDDQGFAIAPATVPAAQEAQARKGAAACPEDAIIVNLGMAEPDEGAR
jgi:ferredoxin